MLRTIADDVFAFENDLRMPVGPMPARTTILRRADGGLIVHSPLAIDDDTARAIDAVGEVRALVAPSKLHWMFLQAASERWPRASVLGPPGLEKKLPDLAFTPLPATGAAAELGADVAIRLVEGVPYLAEHVFLHARSRTLVVTDLVFNVHEAKTFGMKAFLWVGGAWKKTAQDRVWRVLTKNRAAAARGAEEILRWDFDRVVLAHGELIDSDAKARMEDALAWMRKGA